MTEGVANPGVLCGSAGTTADGREARFGAVNDLQSTRKWSPEEFAREQLRGLVRQVFFSNAIRPVRQVVFSALDADTEVREICRNVGETLARETADSVAVVGEYPRRVSAVTSSVDLPDARKGLMPLHRVGIRMTTNLWLVPGAANDSDSSCKSLSSYLNEVRREFEFSVVHAPPAAESDVAAVMGQFADGLILILSAERTRRVVAGQVKNALEAGRVRILGTILSDRRFPIPEGIYRRL